jgi:hypothetical protein
MDRDRLRWPLCEHQQFAVNPGSPVAFQNNRKGGGNPPPVHRLEPVIAVDFGLVDEYPYIHIGQKIFSPVDRQSADYLNCPA